MLLRFLVSFSCLATSSLFSATWNLNGNGDWNVNGNWTTPAIFPNGIDAVANFGNVITANAIITLGQDITIGTLTIADNNSYTIGSSSLTKLIFQSTGPTATFTKGAGNHTISTPIELQSDLDITNTTANTTSLILNGVISGPGNLSINNNVFNRVDLAVANTYAGDTSLNSGDIRYLIDGAIPANSHVTLGTGAGTNASLNIIIPNPTTGMSPSNAFFLDIGSNGMLTRGANRAIYLLSLSGSGSVNLNTGSTASSIFSINGSQSTTFSGTITSGIASTSGTATNGSRVYKAGTSTLTLTGNSTYVSRTFIEEGSINITNENALGSPSNAGGSPAFVMSSGSMHGTLSLNGNINLQKSLSLNGPGFSTGALVNVTGANIVSQPVTIGWSGGGGSQSPSDATISVSGTSLTFSDVVQGSNNLTKTGSSPLIYTGSSANTLTGTTILDAGTLQLNKTAGVNALAGNVQINPSATLLLNATNQIIDTADVAIAGGTFNMNGNAETIGSLTFTSGTLTQTGSEVLTLANNAAALIPALTMRDTTISGNLAIINGGTVVFDATNNGTARIEGDVNLGGMTSDFNIADGSATPDMLVSGNITNGSITKSDSGWLQLTGTNSFTGTTLINAGTLEGDTNSLPSDIVDNGALVFTQNFDGTYSNSLSGTGTMLKRGIGSLTFSNANVLDGLTTISEGSFIVNGTFGGNGDLITDFGTTLRGTGTISKNSTINGTLNPGQSTSDVGILNFIGNQTLTGSSNLSIDITPTTSDLVNVTGTFTIESGSTLNLIAIPGNYDGFLFYNIVHTTAGVSGTFADVTSTLPLLNSFVIYTPTDIFVEGFFGPFSSLFSQGNAGAVARCLDILNPSSGSDLMNVIFALRLIDSESALKDALLQLQPSAFSSLSLAQENNTFYIRNTILNRLDERLHSCSENCYSSMNFWIAPIIGYSTQQNVYVSRALDTEPGYEATTPGIFTGIDQGFSNCTYLGGGFGYTFTDLEWKQNRGMANIHSMYAAVYGRMENKIGYLQGTFLGAYNLYAIDRLIDFPGIQRTAFSNHEGIEGCIDLETGLMFALRKTTISPFINLNYIFINEEGFAEHGADSLNLFIQEKNSDVLTSEFGIDISQCLPYSTPFLQLSVIRESRFQGSLEQASFCPCLGNCAMNVYGLYPSRTLAGLTLGMISFINHENHFLSAYYRGKYGNGFQDHSFSLEVKF